MPLMAPGMGGSLYEVLRVEPTAMISEIKTVYRSFAKVYHHDLLGNGWDFTEIHNAYETLSDPKARAVYDMSLNHNYAVDPATLPKGVEVTHINLNDGTCAGLAYPALNVMSLQYHLEASPGPHDSDCVFRDFVELMKSVKYRA